MPIYRSGLRTLEPYHLCSRRPEYRHQESTDLVTCITLLQVSVSPDSKTLVRPGLVPGFVLGFVAGMDCVSHIGGNEECPRNRLAVSSGRGRLINRFSVTIRAT